MSTNKPSSSPSQSPLDPAARVIPKFSSFTFQPPAPLSATVPTSAVSGSEKEDKRDKEHRHVKHRSRRSRSKSPRRSSREYDHNRDRDRSRHHRRKRERSNHRDRSRSPNSSRRAHRSRRSPPSDRLTHASTSSRHLQASKNSKEDTSKLWFFDTKGDEYNLIYGTIHRYSIPAYRRYGYGRILGLSTRVVIDREKQDGKGLVLRVLGHDGEDRSRADRYIYATAENKGLKRLKIRKDGPKATEDFAGGADFVLFSKPKPQGQGDRSDDALPGSALLGPGEGGIAMGHDDLEAASESDSDVEYVGSVEWGDRQRMVEYIRRVDTEPTNVSAWLAYVNQQDAAIGIGSRKRTAAERTSIAEVKLDILTKALAKNPGNELLLLRFMDVAQDTWDSQKLLSKWHQILSENPSIIALWTRYLNVRQTDVISFTYPECVKCYSSCLDKLRTTAFSAAPGSSQRGSLEEIYVYVLLRLLMLMRESGYQELSTAVLQAMLELNIFNPSHITSPTSLSKHHGVLAELERFWDSEVSRIGEDKALGWGAFFAAGEEEDAPDAVDISFAVPPLDPRDPFSTWVDTEFEISNKPRMPARTTDDVEEDDPYRVVLFSDIKPFLFRLSCHGSIESLMDALLIANGLPRFKSCSSNDNWVNDPFLWNSLPATNPESLREWFWPKKDKRFDTDAPVWEGMEPERKAGVEVSPFTFQVNNFPMTDLSLFEKSDRWFSSLNGLALPRQDTLNFVRHALKSAVHQTSNETLAIYYLAWEWANSPSSVKKVAKLLLQKFKTSLRLWAAYARIEWQESGRESGAKIFTLSLNMSQGFSEESKRDVAHLWHAWIWEEILAGNIADARRLLLSVVNHRLLPADTGFSSPDVPKTLLLASKQYFHEQQLRYNIQHPSIAAVYNDFYALLQYLCTPNPSLADIADIYTTFASSLSAHPAVHEVTLLQHIRLLYYHNTTTKYYQPSTLRNTLESALSAFPHNTAFLSLYFYNESRTRIENRVRGILSRNNAVSAPASALFAVWTELHMTEHWNKHSVRHLFESACEDNNSKHSALWWRMWMEFEVRVKAPENAKMVMWRAMKECPWYKDIFMLGLKLLRGAMSMEEMWKCVAIVANEKELRVHDVTELEDAWEELRMVVGTRGGIVLPDDKDSDDEMED